ncbi:putative aminomethyl transferase [Thozetella sp. PMI_491]|nr:putative aminomethyl transferase [Thozetella sp. PMI_491]
MLHRISIPATRQPDIGAPPQGTAPTAGIARLKSRRLISVSGPDAAKHLHGLMTRNVQNGMPHTAGFYAAFLSAKGRVLHDVFVYPHNTLGSDRKSAKPEDSFLVEVDADEAKVLWAHLKRYKLRLKVFIRLLDQDEATVWQAWADPKLLRSVQTAREDGLHVIQDTRAPDMGYRFVTRGGSGPPPPMFRLPTAHQSAYRLRRYLRGVPEGQGEILYEQALPFESNLDLMGGIDFHKGCYIGQELTIRTKHRGVVRKRTLPCVAYAPEEEVPRRLEYSPGVKVTVPSTSETEEYDIGQIPPDTNITREGRTGRAAGKWMHGVGNIGLALCRLEVMTDLGVPGMPDVATGSPDDAFIIQPDLEATEAPAEDAAPAAGAQEAETPRRKGAYQHPYMGPKLRVKAFVPDWVREGVTSEPSKA